MGRMRLSRKTVWGQAQPHQARPHSAVTREMLKTTEPNRKSK
jgi:hypothetical protein